MTGETTEPTAWPSPDLERLAASAEELAERLAEPELRAQAFGLAALIRNLGRERETGAERELAEADLERALQSGSHEAVVSTALHLARLDRDAVLPVDWSKVTGG